MKQNPKNMALFILACIASPLLQYSTTSTTSASSRIVYYVCKSTTHKAFCHAVLDPWKSSTDDGAYELAIIAFSLTYYNATSTKDFIDLWLKDDSKLGGMKSGMLHCEACYQQAIEALQKASEDLKKRYFERLGGLAMYVMNRGRSCAKVFHNGFPDASYMAKSNQDLIDLAEISGFVSNYLVQVPNAN